MFFIGRFFTTRCITVVFSFCALTTSLNAEEDYYTWVDENGVTNYSERNPLEYQARYITKTRRFGQRIALIPTETTKAPNPPQGRPAGSPNDVIAAERSIVSAEIASAKKSNCDIGKRNLARLEMFSRIRVTDEKGQNRILSSEEKSVKEADTRKIIRENCSG